MITVSVLLLALSNLVLLTLTLIARRRFISLRGSCQQLLECLAEHPSVEVISCTDPTPGISKSGHTSTRQVILLSLNCEGTEVSRPFYRGRYTKLRERLLSGTQRFSPTYPL